MYNFFSNNTKRKAFIKALKEVEETGIYADYAADENAARLKPDVEAEIAALTKKAKEPVAQDDTLDISKLSMEDISQATSQELKSNAKPTGKPVERPQASDDIKQISADGTVKQTAEITSREQSSEYYDRLFARRSFLEGNSDYDDLEFVTGRKSEKIDGAVSMQPVEDDEQQSQADAQAKSGTQTTQEKPKERFASRVLDKMSKDNQDKRATELKDREAKLNKDREEFSRLQQQELLRREAKEQELKQREEAAKLAAEQAEASKRQAEEAAARAKAEAEEAAAKIKAEAQAEAEKTKAELAEAKAKAEAEAAAAAAAKIAAASKPKKAPSTPRKRKRRYDADIIGGFDF